MSYQNFEENPVEILKESFSDYERKPVGIFCLLRFQRKSCPDFENHPVEISEEILSGYSRNPVGISKETL